MLKSVLYVPGATQVLSVFQVRAVPGCIHMIQTVALKALALPAQPTLPIDIADPTALQTLFALGAPAVPLSLGVIPGLFAPSASSVLPVTLRHPGLAAMVEPAAR